MKLRIPAMLALLSLVLVAAAAKADVGVGPGGHVPGTASNLTLVGHSPLFDRGMNAAPAVFDHFVYVGNRTDGSSRCGAGDPCGVPQLCHRG